MPDREGHGQHCQTKGQRDAKQTDAHIGKGSSQHRTAAPAKDQPEGPEELRTVLFHSLLLSLVNG